MLQNVDTDEIIIDIWEVLSVLRKHIGAIIAVGIVAGIIGFYFTNFFVTPIYQANAKMIVNTRTDQKAMVTNDQLNSAKNLVDTYAIIIRSKTVLQSVKDNLDLEYSLPQLQQKLSVTSVNGTQVMQIAVHDPNPERAKDIVEQIVVTVPDIIVETVEAGSVKTIETPTVSYVPVSPNKRINTLLSAMLGIIVVAVFFIIKFILDNTFKSELDIQKHLDIPVLGIIPTIESCERNKGGK